MKRKKLLITVIVLVVLGAIFYANVAFRKTTGTEVTVEKIQKRDLEAIVSASGTIQPKTSVDISADTMGHVTNLAVNEGDIVKKGQFLLQIDPRNLETAVTNQQASLEASKSSLEEMRKTVDNLKHAETLSKATFDRAANLYKAGLATRQDYENAETDLKAKQTSVQQGEQSLKTQDLRIKQQQAMLDSAAYDLTKVRIVSPLDGIVTRRNILEGEVVVIGTMNNAGTVLLTVADMSVIQAEIDVDETDIPNVKVGQPAKVKIDAIPDKEFPGVVSEVGNSPIQSTAASATRATNFKVKVMVKEAIPTVRPGFTCSATITTATRQQVVAVPIQATTVREMVVDAEGVLVRDPLPEPGKPRRPGPVGVQDLKPGQNRKEIEGVFVVRNGRAIFTPVKTGIVGEKFFEVLEGLKEADEVINGPFSSVRGMRDGDEVKVTGTQTTQPPVKKS